MNKELQDLHPEIKKFWMEKYNQKISHNEHFGKGGIEWYVFSYKSILATINRHIIAFSDVAKDWETTYYFDGAKYSEEEMLKVIKMKGFT